MSIEIKNNSGLKDLISEIETKPLSTLQSELPKIQSEIQSKSQSGIQYDGSSMNQYSEGYRSFKQGLGQSGSPNLTLTGDMLNSLSNTTTSSNTRIEAKIEITGADNRNKAFWNQGGNSRIPPRYFMALAQEQVRSLIQKMYNFIK